MKVKFIPKVTWDLNLKNEAIFMHELEMLCYTLKEQISRLNILKHISPFTKDPFRYIQHSCNLFTKLLNVFFQTFSLILQKKKKNV